MKSYRELNWSRAIDRHMGGMLLRLLPRGTSPGGLAGEPRRILVIKLHGIGNIVMMLPALRALRRCYPNAEIELLTLSSNREFAQGTFDWSALYDLDERSLLRLLFSAAAKLPPLLRRRYDAVFDFEQFILFSALVSRLTRAPVRVGFEGIGGERARAFTHVVPYVEDDHMGEIFMRIPRALNAGETPGERTIPISSLHREEARRVLGDAGIQDGAAFALFHPGSSANVPLRRWPPACFGRLVFRLSKELGLQTVVTGTPDEMEIAAKVVEASDGVAVDLSGMLSVMALAALCGSARLVVSNDTSVVHIATAMGVAVVGLYGPNTPDLYGPAGGNGLAFYEKLPCSPCLTNMTRKSSECSDARCMSAIDPDRVFEAIKHTWFGG